MLPVLIGTAAKVGTGRFADLLALATLIVTGTAIYTGEYVWAIFFFLGGVYGSLMLPQLLSKPTRRRLIAEAIAVDS